MVLNYVITVIDKAKENDAAEVYRSVGQPLTLSVYGKGTATSVHLDHYGLEATEKVILSAVADGSQTAQIIKNLKRRLFIGIPGNGIVLAVPIKSVGGGKTLAYLTNDAPAEKSKPDFKFSHELIIAVLNQSYSDDVMAAARSAGAFGGTIIHAKGTGEALSKKFFEVSLASERELLLIVASAENKTAIMKAIAEKTGPHTPAGAICFSLPVSEVAGLREQALAD